MKRAADYFRHHKNAIVGWMLAVVACLVFWTAPAVGVVLVVVYLIAGPMVHKRKPIPKPGKGEPRP